MQLALSPTPRKLRRKLLDAAFKFHWLRTTITHPVQMEFGFGWVGRVGLLGGWMGGCECAQSSVRLFAPVVQGPRALAGGRPANQRIY